MLTTTLGVAGIKPRAGHVRPSRNSICYSARFNVNFAVFNDSGEGPGSARRHFPSAFEPRMPSQPPGPAEHFDLLSAEEMESKFPEWIHASTPPAITDREPPGLTALHTPDAGPATGHRRPPSPTVPRALASPPLPYPTSGPAADLQRDLQAKKRIIPS